jgi:1,4-alpha-glucan branching enzyme
MTVGYLCFALHAHLPYVRHPERTHTLEERWLFEALTETYLPLTLAMKRWTQEGLSWRMALSVSPSLASMLADPLLQQRYRAHLNDLIELAEAEAQRLARDPDFHHLPPFYLERFRELRSAYEAWGQNLLQVWSRLEALGHLELMTTAATHAFLPLVLTEEAVRAQIVTAIQHHTDVFGRAPRGIWLPECAYRPGVDELLRDYGIMYFFSDTHGILGVDPAPVFGAYAPILTPAGVAVLARDPECARQVWSATEGYPGDFDYREFYRDIGYERPLSELRSCLPEGVRVDTGLKYCRITGPGGEKAPYQPQQALEKAAQHAGHFLWSRQQQIAHLAGLMGRPPIVTAVYDAELFGHWWYEGPEFLDMLVRKMHFDQTDTAFATPSECLSLARDWQTCRLEMNSWGRDGYADVWLNSTNDWIYPALHRMEREMIRLASDYPSAEGPRKRALNQAARELMLAQSSDWAFIMDHRTAVDYAVRRTKLHVNRFERLTQMIRDNQMDLAFLSEIERRDNIFPNIDYRVYASSAPPQSTAWTNTPSDRPTVLMLAWEYPPLVVGGLARHVANLAEALVAHGWQVHVITRTDLPYTHDEVVDGVFVHRVAVMRPHGGSFLDWVLQLNLAMLDCARQLLASNVPVDVLHAHDWLVQRAAKALKEYSGLPLICTIHATEHGRNGGIYTGLQRRIHHEEWVLTYESAHVIVCSAFMRDEVTRLFALPGDKVTVIPNGIRCDGLLLAGRHEAPDTERVVLFIGRMVREKGVHVLLQAAPRIRSAVPHVRFVLIGRGPMEEDLRAQASRLGLDDVVQFLGFISDAERDAWLRRASVCVFPSLYEPFGIVALEAMAAGVPVVVSDAGGLREIVHHEETGLTAFTGHADSLADQTIRLLQDPTLARRVSVRAIATVRERFAWESIAARTAEIYAMVHRPIRHEEAYTG